MGDPFIIAIDFGTAYSGYAFCVLTKGSTPKPRVPHWGREHGYDTPKTPTCILFDQNEEFQRFGYDAKIAYTRMKGADAKTNYLFENFKMELYGKALNKHIMIAAKNGKSMRAMKVVSESLRYLKDHALKTIADHTSGRKFLASDISWVLTVPAIWDAAAKQFMKEAAIEAGLVTETNSDKLVIALEPEAASVWCKRLPSDGFIAEENNQNTLEQAPGTQYIVVDCGGGTIDITVHEMLAGGALKELSRASGNDLGGETVDKKFKLFLREIFSDGLWDEYEKEYPSELQKIMYEFSVLKCTDEDIEISCPFNLSSLAQKRQDMQSFFTKVHGASWDEGSIKIASEKVCSFFEESLRGITNSVKEILKKDFKIELILLVGGFASSKILQSHIKKKFGNQCKVLCPHDPQKAIVMGAVLFGENPKVVSIRVSGLTYGIACSCIFDQSKHKLEKKSTNDDGEWCDDLFQKLVEIHESVGSDEVREHIFCPIKRDQTAMNFKFFSTERHNAKYVDEWGMEEIGSFTVPMTNICGGMGRRVRFEIKFGCTEMTATATDITSNETEKIKLDFMRK